MIGGTTAFDASELALNAIDAEWTFGHDLATRVANLSGDAANPGYGTRLNGDVFLIPLRSAFADGAADSLTGSSGSDWYIVDALDAVNGANNNPHRAVTVAYGLQTASCQLSVVSEDNPIP